MAEILDATESNLDICKEALENSKVIAVPTETVYGLAGNALDETALSAIFKIKGRPLFNPLIIHCDRIENAEKYALFHLLARQLAEKFWPGPLTMVLPKREIVPNLVTANLDSVAIRCPHNKVFLQLLKKLSFPLAAPSANPFGYVSPTTAEHVKCSLGDKIDFILNDNHCEIGIESTIIDLRNPQQPKVLRPGPITKEDLEKLTGIEFKLAQNLSHSEVRAPGMLKAHYSPSTPLEIMPLEQIERYVHSSDDTTSAYIFLKRPEDSIDIEQKNIYWLSENGDDLEIAHNFYDVLRTVDTLHYKAIFIEAISEHRGLKAALVDRLTKAASPLSN